MMKNIYGKAKENPIVKLVAALKLGSIQFIISLSITIITITAMLIIGITFYNKYTITSEQNATINTRQVIDQVNKNLDFYLRSMMDISDSLKDITYTEKNVPNNKLTEEMDVILSTRKDIVSLAVFSSKGELLTGVPVGTLKDRAKITSESWFNAPLERPGNLYFSSPHVQNLFEGQHSWVVSLSRAITFSRNGVKEQGVLLVDMNFRAIDQFCQNVRLGKKGYIYIIDSKGNIVYHPQQQLINIGLKSENVADILAHAFGRYFDNYNGEKRLIIIDTVNYSRWRIVGVAYMDEIVSTKKEIADFVVYTVAVGIFLVIFISSYISSKISQPIKKLEKSMKLVEEGQLDINVDIKGEDEVVQLAKTFNIMVFRIRHLMGQIVVEQEAKRKSELNALQAQINPHFLYNTLDSIVWMAENGNSEDVITMVTALARLFRISISRGRNIIEVRQELEHARNYLIIQKIRYKNKFEFEIEASEECMSCRTMKLILQPIIENAIYHGIEYMVDKGLIRITVSKENGKLLYKVIDNGLGMDTEKLKNILEYEAKGTEGSSGVGVKNVHERIQLYYGKEYGLEIESVLEAGTTVKIWLPFEEV